MQSLARLSVCVGRGRAKRDCDVSGLELSVRRVEMRRMLRDLFLYSFYIYFSDILAIYQSILALAQCNAS